MNPLDVEVVVKKEEFSINPVVGFDPFIVFEFKPELCPHFPEKRETLSLDDWIYSNSRSRKYSFIFRAYYLLHFNYFINYISYRILFSVEILRHYDFKTSSLHIHREIMYSLNQGRLFTLIYHSFLTFQLHFLNFTISRRSFHH